MAVQINNNSTTAQIIINRIKLFEALCMCEINVIISLYIAYTNSIYYYKNITYYNTLLGKSLLAPASIRIRAISMQL